MDGLFGRLAVLVVFALLPAAAIGGGLALPVILCVGGALALAPRAIIQGFESRPVTLSIFLLFWAWVVASSLWSPYPGHAQAAKLAALIPLGLLFVAGGGRHGRLLLAAGCAAAIVLAGLLSIEALWGMPLNHAATPQTALGELGRKVSRASTVLLSVGWATAGAFLATDRPSFARAALLLFAILMLPFGQLASLVAFGAGLCAFALAFAAPRFALWSVCGGLAAWVLAAPFLTPLILADPRLTEVLPLSWSARIGIWDYVCARIVEQPWLGHGLDASRAVTDRVQVAGLDIRAIQLHPHSASLQIWFETGGVGAVLAALALLSAGQALSQSYAQHRIAAAAAAATIASIGVIANVSFGAWQEWWIATIMIAATFVRAVGATRI
ncbi:MAG: O-antigen ligase family protein [Hyphomonadaceae bacterium]|nr:O-antigen ligase family protein [Hyphomonadaceae bacterium]